MPFRGLVPIAWPVRERIAGSGRSAQHLPVIF